MQPFKFYEPESLTDACSLLTGLQGNCRLLAGGTDLLVQLKENLISVDNIINLKLIPGLDKIEFDENFGLRVGALVTWTMLRDSKAVRDYYPALMQAAETMACDQVRNRATLAGNICHASPAANGPIPLLLYDAECRSCSSENERKMPIARMFSGVQENSLNEGEILAEIIIPPPTPGVRSIYHKYSTRRAMDLAIVGVGVSVLRKNGLNDNVRIALGSVSTTPIRALKAERLLTGKSMDSNLIEEACELACNECNPVSDVRASRQYRLELVRGLVSQALKECSA